MYPFLISIPILGGKGVIRRVIKCIKKKRHKLDLSIEGA